MHLTHSLSSVEASYSLTACLRKNAQRLGRGKIKARGNAGKGKERKEAPAFSPFPSFPSLPFSLSSAPAPVFFCHWCLLTGASTEERLPHLIRNLSLGSVFSLKVSSFHFFFVKMTLLSENRILTSRKFTREGHGNSLAS